MKITLMVVGKTTDTRLQTLIEDYQQRLKHYVPFEFVVVPESKNDQAILSRLTPAMDVVLLDERGQEFRSIELADWLQKKMNSGKDLMLIIGGPFGFSKEVYARANGQWSLSRLTFSHQMIRIMAIEQIYRAMTILRNEPYHHE
ncbi:MAG: 23S rRNA (pseudouridine(1915)-N(3))-methyltransferase RlmH [Paludibacteraceae bacterium]|nr:23S rRNA (pseudouridine(1915)-N(3))-methyltransferase RlmH [Paludibacteraceae bacterium]